MPGQVIHGADIDTRPVGRAGDVKEGPGYSTNSNSRATVRTCPL